MKTPLINGVSFFEQLRDRSKPHDNLMVILLQSFL